MISYMTDKNKWSNDNLTQILFDNAIFNQLRIRKWQLMIDFHCYKNSFGKK